MQAPSRAAMKQLYMVMAGAAYSMGRLLCVVAGVPAPAQPGRGREKSRNQPLNVAEASVQVYVFPLPSLPSVSFVAAYWKVFSLSATLVNLSA